MYRTPVADLDDLKIRIRLAIQNVTTDILSNPGLEADNTLDICRARSGSHVLIRGNCNSLDLSI